MRPIFKTCINNCTRKPLDYVDNYLESNGSSCKNYYTTYHPDAIMEKLELFLKKVEATNVLINTNKYKVKFTLNSYNTTTKKH